ncbi:hypothetical protein SEA_SHAOBING_88 [Mycobacterium phage Shaobing]|nr:hypothetical protein SEA_SHAOBING_88 [Mycobacterium phage Shaobing]
MGSASVLFLDGPLAGQTRDVATWRGNVVPPDAFYAVRPRPDMFARQLVDEHDTLVQHETITYRLKRNRLPYGPRWAYALGEKVGEQIVTVVPYLPAAREAVGGPEFEGYVSRHAHEAMQRHAASVGLVAMHVHEVWRGTRAEAREQMEREGKHVPGVPVFDSAGLDVMLAETVFVVHEGVAMPEEGSAWAA